MRPPVFGEIMHPLRLVRALLGGKNPMDHKELCLPFKISYLRGRPHFVIVIFRNKNADLTAEHADI